MDCRQDGTTCQGAGLWWQSRSFLVFCILVSALPLLWPAVAPLGDMGDHIGRYTILAEAGRGPLSRYYAVHWAMVGNLGVDAVVLALHALGIGIEPAAKIAVLAIPPLTVAGMIALARAAHGRVPASAMLAFPLAYCPAFQMGFVNFCLAQALMLLAIALWLRLARRQRPIWRVGAFAIVAPLLWLCHALGWALLIVYLFGIELGRRIERGQSWRRGVPRAALMVAPMALPALWMFKPGGDRVAGDSGIWSIENKLRWILTLFQDRWMAWDLAALGVLILFAYAVVRSRRLSVAPILGVPAAIGVAIFFGLPYLFRGGAYLDMRMLAPAVMLTLLAVRVRPEPSGAPSGAGLALVATGFFLARIIGTTLGYAQLADAQERELQALTVLPPGGKVLVLANVMSEGRWNSPRRLHVAGLAITRAGMFTNTQWAVPGQQLVRPIVPDAAPFDRDPSALVVASALDEAADFDTAIGRFNRCAFDAVWTVGFPVGRARSPDLIPIWAQGDSAVYRVRRGLCLSDAPSVR
ncbi:hypothetical protein [uncultured Sphingomonas sp.]|uniref:hypothetical protein n=1 Tax=uncultured Sphingomonas sp. TaxID=158754 RepID=UPI0025F3AA8E|nr:hypothetical protein [uncultured Sphingomonas sp.]